MVDVRGDVLRPPHGTTSAAVKSNIKSEMRSFKSNENIYKKEGGSYYVVSANKASSVTLELPGDESQMKHTAILRISNRQSNKYFSWKKKNRNVILCIFKSYQIIYGKSLLCLPVWSAGCLQFIKAKLCNLSNEEHHIYDRWRHVKP